MLLLLYYIQRVGVICPHLNTRYAHLRAAKSKAYRETPPKRYVPCTLLPANGVFQALFIFYTLLLAKSVFRVLPFP